MGIEKILTECYKQLYANRIRQFRWSIRTRNIHLTKTETRRNKTSEYFFLSIKEIKSVITGPTKKSLGPDIFTGEFFQAFKKEIILSLHNLYER